MPRNPANLDPADPDNPYADYTVTQLYDFLASYELTTDPGSHFEYSNVGAALLGHALALRAGMPFEDLVRTRILEPLDMTSTGITLDAATAGRFVDGHDARGNVTSRFDMAVLAGAGGLRSSVNDMLKFAAANLDPHGDELHQAMAAAQEPRRPTDVAAQQIALAWNVDTARRQHDHLARRRHRRVLRLPRPRPDSSHRRGRPQQLARQEHRRHRRPPPRPHPAAPAPAGTAHRSRPVPRGPRPLRR